MLTIWNLQDLENKGAIKYGDMVLLQIGRNEARGHDTERGVGRTCSAVLAPHPP